MSSRFNLFAKTNAGGGRHVRPQPNAMFNLSAASFPGLVRLRCVKKAVKYGMTRLMSIDNFSANDYMSALRADT